MLAQLHRGGTGTSVSESECGGLFRAFASQKRFRKRRMLETQCVSKMETSMILCLEMMTQRLERIHLAQIFSEFGGEVRFTKLRARDLVANSRNAGSPLFKTASSSTRRLKFGEFHWKFQRNSTGSNELSPAGVVRAPRHSTVALRILSRFEPKEPVRFKLRKKMLGRTHLTHIRTHKTRAQREEKAKRHTPPHLSKGARDVCESPFPLA